MKVVIQRVSEASVIADGVLTGAIEKGLLVLLGIHAEDSEKDMDWMIHKITQMRIFSDDNDKMNLSVKDIEGNILLISQFTLLASTKKGNRPSYLQAAPPSIAIPIYERFIEKLKASGFENIQTGIFGADMKIQLVNDGPVTIVIDSQCPE
ncbi:MAG TPA: D-aminoacyl-tRNA deacylase [Chitinophagales bacterium]|nr:D-aminoacyl-tRNA deacylase [Chitinophagales bacterium]